MANENGEPKRPTLNLAWVVVPSMIVVWVLALATLFGHEAQTTLIAELLAFVSATLAGLGAGYAVQKRLNSGKEEGS